MTILLQKPKTSASLTDEDGNTPLHHAAGNGWTSVAKRLIEYENTADFTNKKGQVPLKLAIDEEHNECATFLVESMEPVRYM